MSLSVLFDGHELSEYLNVSVGFDRGIGPNKSISLQKNGIMRGKDFVSTTNDDKTITMPFVMCNDLGIKRRELAKILDVDEPKELIFGDEPDVFYYALPSDIPKLDEIHFLGKASIDWVIPDGVAHAKETKEFTAKINKDGILEMTVANEGTEPVPISFDVDIHADNGYFSAVSEYGVMEFGNIKEVDGTMVETPKSKTLVATNNLKDWEQWQKGNYNTENPKKICNMELGVRQDSFNTALGDLIGEMQKEGNASGGLRYVDFESSRNVYLWFRYWFETALVGQTGTSGINLVSEDGTLVCSLIIEKLDASGNTARAILKVGGENPKQYEVFPFLPTHWRKDNPITWEEGGGAMDIRKIGGTITMFWNHRFYSCYVPELENVKVSRVEFYVGQWNGRNLTNQKVTRMYLRRISVTQLNVEEWQDNPNRWTTGDHLFIDGESKRKQFYVNGQVSLRDEVVGTKYFKVPSGETKIQFYYSDFSQPIPSVRGTIREAWQ
ncbi:distal tail protein Dit [Enterococcus faecalis]